MKEKWQSFRYRENEHIDYRGHAHRIKKCFDVTGM